jgi:hemerythrin-like domain-containing protein
MMPIGPLMIEHRLIERMIALMDKELTRIRDNAAIDPEFAFVDPVFIDTAVDFMKTYADRCHHGKEEDLLFAELVEKELPQAQKQIVKELKADHVWGRETTGKLLKAKDNYLLGSKEALNEIFKYLGELVEFYPKHIEKEDKHFFIPCMEHFSRSEKDALLQKMWDFDRKMIHEKYGAVVEQIEKRRACRI